jgi:transposase
MEKFIASFGPQSIAWLLADREFVGKKWFRFLHQHKIPFRIRVKQNFQVASKKGQIPVMAIFQHLKVDEILVLPRKRLILGQRLYLIGLRLEDEYLLLVTDQKPATALEDYAKRWDIETLFGILKSRGFRFEETHLTEGDRINKLLALLTLATVWAFKVGAWLHEQEPLKIKKHGRLAKSIFRYGLDFLRATLFDIQLKMADFQISLNFLSCT